MPIGRECGWSNLVNHNFDELYHANGASNGYDNLNQLVSFARGVLSDTNGDGVPETISSFSHSQNWGYDALGNWSNFTNDGISQTETLNKQNEIVTISGQTSPIYDSNGNMTRDQSGKTLVYDAWNRLVQVKNGNTVLVSYSYDGLGRRITESSTAQTDLYFSALWQVIEDRVSGNTQDQYVWSPVYVDALIERDRDADGITTNGLEERLYVQQDANWNVTALADATGAVQERYAYDPFGQVTILTSGATPWNYLFQGGRYDSVTGLYNFRNRDYSPTLGRWMEVDPLGFAAGDSNLYREEGNSPTNWTDPGGLDWFSKWLSELLFGTSDAAVLDARVYGGGFPGPTPYGSGLLGAGGAVAGGVGSAMGDNPVGAPGTLESLFPVWGSGRESINDFQNGKVLEGALNGLLAITDVFLVKSILQAAVKGIELGLGKILGQGTAKELLEEAPKFLQKAGQLCERTAPKTVEDFLPQARKILAETKAKYGNVQATAMAMSRQKALERLNTRSGNIIEHLEKIAKDPNSSAVNHWKNEIRNWIREMEDALPHAGSKTAEGWEKLVNAYKQVVEGLP